MPKWPRSILPKLGTLTLIGYVAWLGWENLGPRKPGISPPRKELADKVIPVIVEDLRTSRGSMRQVALLHFSNDPTDYFTNTLRSIIQQTGALDLCDCTTGEKARDALNLRHPSYPSTAAALARGRELEVQGVLFGDIHAFESSPTGATIDAEVTLAEVSTGRTVLSKRYTQETSLPSSLMSAVQDTAGGFPWLQRLFSALLAVLLLPVFTIGFIRAMVRKESNKANAFVLSIYTLADALFAWLLVGPVLNSLWSIIVFVIAVVVAFAYNVRIMTFALRLEEA